MHLIILDVRETTGTFLSVTIRKLIEMMGEDRKYIICSNDVDRYKKVFKGDNFFFNDMKTKSEKAFFDLCLISKCDDFIISNSTFSWWGCMVWVLRVVIHPMIFLWVVE